MEISRVIWLEDIVLECAGLSGAPGQVLGECVTNLPLSGIGGALFPTYRGGALILVGPNPKRRRVHAKRWIGATNQSLEVARSIEVHDCRRTPKGRTKPVATTKRILCLANSRKLAGRCVAGVELTGGRPAGWIRPVSAREHQEVSEYERQYSDGSDPRPLDIIDIPLLEHRPQDYQQENWLLDAEYYWKKVGKFRWDRLHQLAATHGILWQNGYRTYNGSNDQIPLDQAVEETSSLKSIHVDELQLNVFAPGAAFGNAKRRVQARFRFAADDYALWVTDPRIERTYLAREDGNYRLAECYLTISLGEPFKGHHHKLVAAVMDRP